MLKFASELISTVPGPDGDVAIIGNVDETMTLDEIGFESSDGRRQRTDPGAKLSPAAKIFTAILKTSMGIGLLAAAGLGRACVLGLDFRVALMSGIDEEVGLLDQLVRRVLGIA